MKTTRDADLEILELSRDRDQSDVRRARKNAVMDMIDFQSKDPILEKKRDELARWINYGMVNVPDEGQKPTVKQVEAMAVAEMNIKRIEREVQEYARQPGFQRQMLQAMAKHDPVRAEVIAQKQKKGLI